MNVFEVFAEDGKLEASIVLLAIDSITRTPTEEGTECHLRGGHSVFLKRIPIETVAEALRKA
jgi:hypothetical protein